MFKITKYNFLKKYIMMNEMEQEKIIDFSNSILNNQFFEKKDIPNAQKCEIIVNYRDNTKLIVKLPVPKFVFAILYDIKKSKISKEEWLIMDQKAIEEFFIIFNKNNIMINYE
jgi:hypothetical protein